VTRVFVSPDYTRTNPYQQLLARALRERGVEVEHVADHGPLMPLQAVRARGTPDVVHLHWLHPFLLGRNVGFTLLKSLLFFAQLLVLKRLGVRLVWTAHNLTEHDARRPRLERALKHVLVRCVDAVLVHCEAAADRVIEAYDLPERYRDRLRTVPHGHYCDIYQDDVSREEARDELGLGEEFTFLFFGRVCAYKNVTGLVETFARLDAPETRLLVVGNPRSEAVRARVERAAARDDRVETTLEFVPGERVQYYMNAADVVALPFREVLTSGSTILAMSFGKPVVVPEVGCVASVVPGDGGLTYRDDAPDALRSTLRATMDADLDAVGAANRAAVEAVGWDSVARLTADAYDA